MKPLHGLHRPRRDGSGWTWCGRFVKPVRDRYGHTAPTFYMADGRAPLRAIKPYFLQAHAVTCKVCLQVKPRSKT